MRHTTTSGFITYWILTGVLLETATKRCGMPRFTHHSCAYLYLPVGGSKQSKVTKAFSVFSSGKRQRES